VLEAQNEGVWYGEATKLVAKRMDPKYLKF
jgi:(2Fe-2S) ferredoxin